MAFEISFPDSEFEKPFRVYSNYLGDLAGAIGGRYGLDGGLLLGIKSAMESHGPLADVQRRRPGEMGHQIDAALQKAWSIGGRVSKEVEGTEFDAEANAWLPEQAYYAVHHAMRAVVLAATGDAPREHRKILNVVSAEVVGGRLVFPWNTFCAGCPQLGTQQFGGLSSTAKIEVLSSPDPSTTEDRLAILLSSTRKKQLERRFRELRERKPAEGRSRRNVGKAEKERTAKKLPATTVFDFFFRTRKKVHYEDPDVFVLGAAGAEDARRFAESLAIVTDGTLAVLECLVAAYVGKRQVASAALNYADRKNAQPSSMLGRRAAAWAGVVPAEYSDR